MFQANADLMKSTPTAALVMGLVIIPGLCVHKFVRRDASVKLTMLEIIKANVLK